MYDIVTGAKAAINELSDAGKDSTDMWSASVFSAMPQGRVSLPPQSEQPLITFDASGGGNFQVGGRGQTSHGGFGGGIASQSSFGEFGGVGSRASAQFFRGGESSNGGFGGGVFRGGQSSNGAFNV